MSPTRPVLRTPLGLTSLALLLGGVALTVAGGGGPEWFTLDGEVVYRTDVEDLGLSPEDGTLPAVADAFVLIYPGAMFFTALAVAWSGWAQRPWSRVVAGLMLVALAAGFVLRAQEEVVYGDGRGPDESMVVIGTGLVTAAALVGLATMMLGLPQWLRCVAGALLVLAFTVGEAIGLAQILGATGASPTGTPLLSLGSVLALGLSSLVLAVAAARARRTDDTAPVDG